MLILFFVCIADTECRGNDVTTCECFQIFDANFNCSYLPLTKPPITTSVVKTTSTIITTSTTLPPHATSITSDDDDDNGMFFLKPEAICYLQIILS